MKSTDSKLSTITADFANATDSSWNYELIQIHPQHYSHCRYLSEHLFPLIGSITDYSGFSEVS